ncbi:hypothetical protein CONPUDRAFT_74442 [Coniophora puteana RWD-64-598 SS2]|uniref:Uncharacterized protein n=1 Tax=Coniophora puteana (strain RWD-64-598) TaxID=741705 RepID=A0A5M3MJT3_CONPW|nr:uncharacterized protein CONPUDRAFT_74442 [Coniophora puteana RWD-64-598 SS2]EIW78851.1 hypothetical protein CONPUDRAFT_74442 [Coniophora puteana RWD-64-598 SS2]
MAMQLIVLNVEMDTPAEEIWYVLPEYVFYGIFCVLLGVDIRYINLRGRKSTHKVNKYLLITLCLMFTAATLHLACTTCGVYIDIKHQFLEALRISQDFNNYESTTIVVGVITQAAFVSQLWLGDGFMLYRLWKVWNHDKRVVIPMTVAFLINIPLGALVISEIFIEFAMTPLLATSCAVHLGCTVVMNVIVPLVGIVFSAIIIRMGLGLSPETYYTTRGNTEEMSGVNAVPADATIAFAPGTSTCSIETV